MKEKEGMNRRDVLKGAAAALALGLRGDTRGPLEAGKDVPKAPKEMTNEEILAELEELGKEIERLTQNMQIDSLRGQSDAMARILSRQEELAKEVRARTRVPGIKGQ